MLLPAELSGLIDLLAKDHRVIAFDRPGFGHSARPRNRIWTLKRKQTCCAKLPFIAA
jgi:pimeloyl-ACP methyl ester carboxylesterase